MTKRWPFKDPDEVLDYAILWEERLAGDTILTSTWFVPPGITKETDSKTDTITTIWFSGGTLGVTYEILNRITTVGGRTMDQTVDLKIKSK
jgi:hypothetical protein